jgi:hypothetical protein
MVLSNDKDKVMEDREEGFLVSDEMLGDLPASVQRYMMFTGVVGTPWINNVVLKYVGKFRQGLERPWMPMTVKQSYTISPPSFVWNARFKIMGLPLLHARDEYKLGRGRMHAKLAYLFTVFDIQGEKLDQGAMIRYLSEMIWFPTAFLGENITWQAVDSNSADVQLVDAGKSVSGRLYFDDDGRPTNFTAMRYREIDGDFALDAWSTPIIGYGVHAGLNLPTQGQAVWNLQSGDLVYVNMQIEEIEYNT